MCYMNSVHCIYLMLLAIGLNKLFLIPDSSCSDMLNTGASGVHIYYTVSFSILGAIPSTPGDLFSFILLILLATTSGVTTNCPNLSPSGSLELCFWYR